MTLQILNFTGAQALDVQQFIDTTQGIGWLDGVAPSLDEEAGNIQIALTEGTVVLMDTEIPVDAQNVVVPSGDVDWPRRDVIYVDENGTGGVVEGVPRDPVPAGTSGASAERPELNDMSTTDGVVIAGLWVPANASSPGDINEEQYLQDRRVRPWAETVLTDVEPLNVDTSDLVDGAVTNPKIEVGTIEVDRLAFDPVSDPVGGQAGLTVQLDATGTGDNAYATPVFVPDGKTARVFAWGSAPTDLSVDADLRVRLLDETGTEVSSFNGLYEENQEGVAEWENTTGASQVARVEVINDGSNVYQPGGDADGVFVASTFLVEED